MTAQPVQVPSVLAAAPIFNAAGSADTIAVLPSTKYMLHIKNGGGSSINVVIDDPTSTAPAQNTQFNPDVTVVIAAAAERVITLDSTRFRDGFGNVNITFSATASVTYAIYQIS